jgi:ribosomal-protein-alanine N-acetyltransferase
MIRLPLEPFPDLTTQNLCLRQLQNEDADNIFTIRSDEKINQYLDRPLTKSREEAVVFIERINEAVDAGKCLYWAISFTGDNKLVGTICIWNIFPEESKAESGFELNRQYQRMGIMNEAVKCILEFAFEVMQMKTIEGNVHVDNAASIGLMQKNGFTRQPDREMVSNVDPNPCVIYSLSQAAYANGNPVARNNISR